MSAFASSAAAAADYVARGFQPVPVPAGKKRPVITAWQGFRTMAGQDLSKHFPKGGNLGLILGEASGDLVDADLDCTEAVVAGAALLPPTGLVWGREKRPATHYGFVSPGATYAKLNDPTLKGDQACLLELRSPAPGKGLQTIVPPSVHPDGDRYIWSSYGTPSPLEADELSRLVRKIGAVALLARYWPAHGVRHEFALAAAGWLLRGGLSEEDAEAILTLAATAHDAAHPGDFPAASGEALRDIAGAVKNTAAALRARTKATGYTSAKELVDERVLQTAGEWLALGRLSQPNGEGTADDKDTDAGDAGDAGDTGYQAPESNGTPSCASELIAIGRRGELFVDERGEGYVAFTEGAVRRLFKIRSSAFASELSRRYAKANGYRKAANGEAIAAARNVLEAIAVHEGETHPLENRFARRGGAVWIDMGDSRWRAIKVTPGKWEIVDTPPLLFRRFPHQRPHPDPVPGGSLLKLLEPFAMGVAERILLLVYVVVALIANIPRPVLIPHGSQGAGKSTLLKMILALLDPSGADDLDLGSEPKELAQALDQHAVAFFDNVARLLEWQARLLCKAATGGAFPKRKLYTDDETILLRFMRAVMISSIYVPTHAPDLLDRCLLILLDRIAPEMRKREEVLWMEFEANRPAILGGLLDVLARAMAIQPTLNIKDLPRMADFATWGAAAAEALDLELTLTSAGTVPEPGEKADGETLRGSEAFLKAYTANVGRQTEEVLEADPIARAVRDFAQKQERWEGTPSDLFKKLKELHGDEAKTDGWPKRADGLSKRLKVLHSTLADAGVTIRWDRSNSSRTIVLSTGPAPVKVGNDASLASHASPAAPAGPETGDASGDARKTGVNPRVTTKPAPVGPRDASDASDASLGTSTARLPLRVAL